MLRTERSLCRSKYGVLVDALGGRAYCSKRVDDRSDDGAKVVYKVARLLRMLEVGVHETLRLLKEFNTNILSQIKKVVELTCMVRGERSAG